MLPVHIGRHVTIQNTLLHVITILRTHQDLFNNTSIHGTNEFAPQNRLWQMHLWWARP